jgi:hypothetical protein
MLRQGRGAKGRRVVGSRLLMARRSVGRVAVAALSLSLPVQACACGDKGIAAQREI